jgi:hypothetical protein
LIDIIGRKTSQEYAAVTIRNLLRRLQPTYSFLRDIDVKNTLTLELENTVTVSESLNTIDPKKVGNALKDLMRNIMKSMGKTAGFFFIRETREKIGIEFDAILSKTMDVDLTMMQSSYIFEKKSTSLLYIEKSDVIRRFLKTMIDVLEKQTSRTFAINFIAQRVEMLKQQYTFLENISINDIRYTLGSDEITIPPEINDVDSHDLGKAILAILHETDNTLIELGRNFVTSDLKTHLTSEYITKLEEMGVALTAQSIGYDAIFRQVIKTVIDVLGSTSTENQAIAIVNSGLRTIDRTYQFLKDVSVSPATSTDELYHITISNAVNSVDETDARRAIQQLLGTIMISVDEKTGGEFIQKFKEALEKKYLSRIEELGVNLHMIELHLEMGIPVEKK